MGTYKSAGKGEAHTINKRVKGGIFTWWGRGHDAGLVAETKLLLTPLLHNLIHYHYHYHRKRKREKDRRRKDMRE